MRRLSFPSAAVTTIAVASLFMGHVQAQPFSPPFNEDAVLSYVEQVISLQQNADALQAANKGTRETILSDTLRQNTANASKFAFEFAQAQADLIDRPAEKEDAPADAAKPAAEQNADDKPTAPTQSELSKFSETVKTRIKQLEKNLANINVRLRNSTGRTRSLLLTQRENITGELNLAKAQSELVGTLEQTVKSSSDAETSSGLHKKIDNLMRSVASLNPQPIIPDKDADKAAATPAVDSAEADAVENKGGLFQLGTNLLSQWRKQAQMRLVKQQIKDLRVLTSEMRKQLRDTLQSIAKSGNTLAQETGQNKTLQQQRDDFDTLVTNFKTLSTSVAPLSQTSFWLDSAKQNMKDWQNVSEEMLRKTAQQFLIHLGILGIAILIPVILSEIARRMTLKYVKDTRRQRQLRLVRRVIFGIVIVLIIMLNLVSEFGSLATFAGFLTAGIAVALQNVILSIVAHFFFFGRYGVRAGDRVTVGGVTGDVTQVGMVRLYLMEIEGTGDDTRPTGRIVAFPNSILFQPTAFFKHIAAV